MQSLSDDDVLLLVLHSFEGGGEGTDLFLDGSGVTCSRRGNVRPAKGKREEWNAPSSSTYMTP